MFSLHCCITALPEFKQFLFDFFNLLFQSHFILTLLNVPLNLVINGVQFSAVEVIDQEK